MTAPTLDAGAVHLRAISLEDAPELHRGFSDPSLMTYWSRPAHTTLAETQADIAWQIENAADAVWAIVREQSVYGRIGLFPVRDGVRDVGIFLLREAHGSGAARAALEAIVRDGFGRLGLIRIGADIDPDNAPSIRLFERAGFVREGLLRANWRTHIGIRDSVIYARFPG